MTSHKERLRSGVEQYQTKIHRQQASDCPSLVPATGIEHSKGCFLVGRSGFDTSAGQVISHVHATSMRSISLDVIDKKSGCIEANGSPFLTSNNSDRLVMLRNVSLTNSVKPDGRY